MKFYFSGIEYKYFFVSVKTKNDKMILGKGQNGIYLHSNKKNKDYFFYFEGLLDEFALQSKVI